MLRRFGVAGLVMGVVVLVTGPAWAHVSISPESAPKGSFTVLTFNVPNEEATANTTELAVTFPSDHRIADAAVEPVPGWTIKVDKVKVDPPIQTDEGELTEAVSKVTWSGGSIAPGQFQRFAVSVGLPDDADSLVFKAVQTYSDGTKVNWIEETPPGGTEPEHPAPVLTLTSPDGGTTSSTTTATTTPANNGTTVPKDVAKKSDVDSAKTLSIVGIIVGALGLVVALGAVALRRRPQST